MNNYFREKYQQYNIWNYNFLYKYPTIIFGASKGGEYIYEELIKRDIEVLAFCDNDIRKVGTVVRGLPVWSFEQLKKNSVTKELNIVIQLGYQNEIYDQLIKNKVKGNVYRELVFDLYILDRIKKIEKSKILLLLEKYDEIISNLDEIKSREVYKASIEYLLTFNPKVIEDKISNGEQYYIDEVINNIGNRSMIDGGAYTGDTIEALSKMKSKLPMHIHAFEIGEENIRLLENKVNELQITELVTIHKIALWETHEWLTMSAVSGAGITVAKAPEDNGLDDHIETEANSIDSIFLDENIGFIKMDIEGSELKALKGAELTIKRNRPILAICIYHNEEDLYQIPEYLQNILWNYDFKIRKYWYRAAEVVLYAIPKELRE